MSTIRQIISEIHSSQFLLCKQNPGDVFAYIMIKVEKKTPGKDLKTNVEKAKTNLFMLKINEQIEQLVGKNLYRYI